VARELAHHRTRAYELIDEMATTLLTDSVDHRRAHAFGVPLPRHFHQSKLGDRQDVRL